MLLQSDSCFRITWAARNTTAAPPKFNITRVQTEPGLFFEDMGKINLISQYWTIVSYINIEPLETSLSNANATYAMTRRLCQRIEVHSQYTNCDQFLDLIKHDLENLLLQYEGLSQLMGKYSVLVRNRRGLINGIGDLSKWLFGTMSNADSIKIEDALGQLQSTQSKQSILIGQTAAIVRTSIQNFNQSFQALANSDLSLRKSIKRLEQIMDTTRNASENQHLQTSLDLHLNTLNFFCATVGLQLNKITTAILMAQNGQINPNIITPFQIIDILKLHPLPIDLDAKFPLPLTYAFALEVLENAQIKLSRHQHFVIAGIKIPLINPENFNLYRILPIPAQSTNTFLFIQPQIKILAISESRIRYTYFDEPSDCITNHERPKNFCKLKNPLFNVQLRRTCETDALLFPNDPPPVSCHPKQVTFSHTIFHPLQSGNSWLFSTPTTEPGHVLCNSYKDEQQPNNLTLVNTGILTLRPDCMAFTSSAILIPMRTLTEQAHINHPIAVYPSFTDSPTENQLTPLPIPLPPAPVLNFHQLQMAADNLMDIQNKAEDLNSRTITNSHLTLLDITQYVIISLLIICAIGYTIRHLYWKYSNKNPRQTEPESQTTSQNTPPNSIPLNDLAPFVMYNPRFRDQPIPRNSPLPLL